MYHRNDTLHFKVVQALLAFTSDSYSLTHILPTLIK